MPPQKQYSNQDQYRELVLEELKRMNAELGRFKERSLGVRLGPWLTIFIQIMTVLGTVSAGLWFVLKDPIQEAITSVVTEDIRALQRRVNSLEAKQELEPELRSLITSRCNGDRRVELTINRIKAEYRRRTGLEYSEPSCERLTQ